MKTVLVSELDGVDLDWAVAQVEITRSGYRERGLLVHRIGYGQAMPAYSADWGLAGPIIDSQMIAVTPERKGLWSAYFPGNLFLEDGSECFQTGPTPLVAAMRCYVAFKLGLTVEIPRA